MPRLNAPVEQATRRDPAAWELAPVPPHLDIAAAEAFCRRVASAHYENFTVATRLVPAALRQDLANVYTYARWSDDLADEPTEGDATVALAAWRDGLEACFAGRPNHPVFVALAKTAQRHDLSITPFVDLLDAFTQDQQITQYETRDQLLAYCQRSADPVGRIVLALAGCRESQRVALSDAICTGLQLVNFWQDIRRDRQAGRVYLPGEDRRRHGVTEAMLDADQASPELIALVREEVSWARDFFDRGAPLVTTAPPVLRPAIGLFLGGGRGVALAIEQAGYDTLQRRPTLSRLAKAKLAAVAGLRMVRSRFAAGRKGLWA